MQGFSFHDGELHTEPFDCVCGARHQADVRQVIVEAGALERVAQVIGELGPGRRVVLVSDRNTETAAGERVRRALTGSFVVRRCYFDTDQWVRPDERAVGFLMFTMEPDTDFLIAVGSGALTDITRFVAARTGLPFISIPTAPSVDGYTSAGAPITHDGYKRTLDCKQPLAVIADIDILAAAPPEMVRSGFSDTIAKLVSRIDWQLSRVVTGEYYCPTLAEAVTMAAERCVEAADGIGARDKEAIRTLTEALMISGLAMHLVGNSRPASGSEHSLSHYWEMKSHLEDREEHLHGTKVGVATGIVAGFFERFFARLEAGDCDDLDLAALKATHPGRPQMEQRVRRAVGPIADRVIDEVAGSEYLEWDKREAQIAHIQERAAEILRLKEGAPSRGLIIDALQRAGAHHSPQSIGVDRAYLAETLLNSMEVRSRYTVFRAAQSLGWLEELAEEVVELVFSD
jgi:glycerol-1-phosphate dehydrogenase [NAD(P)+]